MSRIPGMVHGAIKDCIKCPTDPDVKRVSCKEKLNDLASGESCGLPNASYSTSPAETVMRIGCITVKSVYLDKI